jgi:hypothetical protein
MKRILALSAFLILLVVCSSCDTIVTGRIITYRNYDFSQDDLRYAINDKEFTATVSKDGTFAIKIDDDQIPVWLDIYGYDDGRQAVNGGSYRIDKKTSESLHIGNIYCYHAIMLKPIPVGIPSKNARLSWVCDVDISCEFWIRIAEAQQKDGKYPIVFEGILSTEKRGDIRLIDVGNIDSILKTISSNGFFLIALWGYSSNNGERHAIAKSPYYPMEIK